MIDTFLTIPELVARYPLPDTTAKSQCQRFRHVLDRWTWSGDLAECVRLRLTKPPGQCGNYPYEYKEARVAQLILESMQSDRAFCASLRLYHIRRLRSVLFRIPLKRLIRIAEIDRQIERLYYARI